MKPLSLIPLLTYKAPPWKGIKHLKVRVKEVLTLTLGFFEGLKGKKIYVDVTLTDDSEMIEINTTHRGQEKTTNVLSFPQYRSLEAIRSFDPVLLGDLVFSYSKIAEEAEQDHLSFEHHLSHLIVHGTLHLLGFDHTTEEEAVKMETLEIEILEKLGIQNPYESHEESPL